MHSGEDREKCKVCKSSHEEQRVRDKAASIFLQAISAFVVTHCRKAPRRQAGQYSKKAKLAVAGDRVPVEKMLGQFFSIPAAATIFKSP